MPSVVGLVFKYLNEIYYTSNFNDLSLNLGDVVIARTIRAKEIGRVIQLTDNLNKVSAEQPFVRKVLRQATEKDFQREESNRDREKKAFSIALKKIEKLGLPMTLIRVHYLFDHSRILFYFKAAGKVDFRQLVRELASVFKARIELRQIGVRDEAKMLGGIATCGRTLCCTSWLRSFAPVTVRMAKDQHLSLNPNKISGLCGRLQCCLEFEQKFYESTLKGVPNMGSLVKTPSGNGKLIKANIFTGQASILLEDASIIQVDLKTVEKRKRGSAHGHCKKRRQAPAEPRKEPPLQEEVTEDFGLPDLSISPDPEDPSHLDQCVAVSDLALPAENGGKQPAKKRGRHRRSRRSRRPRAKRRDEGRSDQTADKSTKERTE